jgi:hypothetical protein
MQHAEPQPCAGNAVAFPGILPCGLPVLRAAEELPLDALRQVWQEGAALSESEKQFSFTCAALSTSGRARKQIQSIQIETQVAL